MKTEFSRETLLQLKALIDNALEDTATEDRPVTRIKLGEQITLHNEDYGDMLMDCVLVSEDGRRGVFLAHNAFPGMEFDAAESAGRGEDYGNNDYELSNVRQWLRSDKLDWWERTHTFDAPPSYADKPGFLRGFDAETLARIAPCDAIHGDLFFLLSYEEVTGEMPYLQSEEGKKLLKKTDGNGRPVWWWLRSPSPHLTRSARDVCSSGDPDGSDSAYNRYGAVAPACIVHL